jgi:hypothetical protein
MPSQEYRGHVIDVTCSPHNERIGCRTTIRSRATGEVRQRENTFAMSFASVVAAEDRAFRDARAWIERSPLHWPFPLPGAPS